MNNKTDVIIRSLFPSDFDTILYLRYSFNTINKTLGIIKLIIPLIL